MSNEIDIKQLLLQAISSPKEVENDSGRVETHDLDDIIKALKYANGLNSASDPFKCLRQTNIRKRDVWQR